MKGFYEGLMKNSTRNQGVAGVQSSQSSNKPLAALLNRMDTNGEKKNSDAMQMLRERHPK